MANEKHHRARADRRQHEIGPPRGWKDRRRTTERRIPEIEECEVSEAEWLLYFGSTTTTTREGSISTTTVLVEIDTAADIFSRIRD